MSLGDNASEVVDRVEDATDGKYGQDPARPADGGAAVDWNAWSHRQIYEMLQQSVDAGSIRSVTAEWENMLDRLSEIVILGKNQVRDTVRGGWHGEAADRALAALEPIEDWIRTVSDQRGQQGELIQTMHALDAAAATAADAKGAVPPPTEPQVTFGSALVGVLKSGTILDGDLIPSGDDFVANADAIKQAQAEARRTMFRYSGELKAHFNGFPDTYTRVSHVTAHTVAPAGGGAMPGIGGLPGGVSLPGGGGYGGGGFPAAAGGGGSYEPPAPPSYDDPPGVPYEPPAGGPPGGDVPPGLPDGDDPPVVGRPVPPGVDEPPYGGWNPPEPPDGGWDSPVTTPGQGVAPSTPVTGYTPPASAGYAGGSYGGSYGGSSYASGSYGSVYGAASFGPRGSSSSAPGFGPRGSTASTGSTASAARGRGYMPMGMGAGGAGQGGDEEHRRKYLIEEEENAIVGQLPPVLPAGGVLGEQPADDEDE